MTDFSLTKQAINQDSITKRFKYKTLLRFCLLGLATTMVNMQAMASTPSTSNMANEGGANNEVSVEQPPIQDSETQDAENQSSEKLITKNQPPSLPTPLSLEALLQNFSQNSAQINYQQASVEQAQSLGVLNQAKNNLELNLQGRLGRREFGRENLPHNLLALHIGKVIYDFEQSNHQADADLKHYEKAQKQLQKALNLQKLEIIKSYFNVILSDFQYRVDNEAIAIEYVTYDKIKDRHQIGQLSDVDLLKAEHSYQQSLLKRSQSEQAQLKTRVQLANTLNLPSARPDELQFPNLQGFKKRSLDKQLLEQIQAAVIEQNPQVQSLRLAQAAQESLILKAMASNGPQLRADAWVGQLSSQPDLREGRWKAQLSVDVPLYDGGQTKSATAIAKAEFLKLKAQTQDLEQSLRNQVAEIYFQLKLLQTEKSVHQAFGDYADLYLDYSRALYENESKTDLGDSFVRLSQANYNMVEWQFKQTLLWLELDYLMGKHITLNSKATANN